MTVRVDPDGTVTVVEGSALVAAQATWSHLSVVTLGAPFLPDDRTWVGTIDDFGAADSEINRKAWGLYGRSPIYGPMFVSEDGGGDLPSEIVEMISRPIVSWPIERRVADLLCDFTPDRPEMLHDRPES